MKNEIFELAKEFSAELHGSSNYGENLIFAMGENLETYVPLSYITKKYPELKSENDLKERGFVYSSSDFLDNNEFAQWYKNQFNKKLTLKAKKSIGILHYPEELKIFGAIEKIVETYEVLRARNVINNGKNLPVQLGEWYAKCAFGLRQVKSSSQRGFDFYTDDNKRVEVIVNWNDRSSPKGVKLKKIVSGS